MRARFSIVRPPDRTDRVHLIASGGERTPDNAGGESCRPVRQANPPLTQPPPLNDGPRQAGALLRLRRGPSCSGHEDAPPGLGDREDGRRRGTGRGETPHRDAWSPNRSRRGRWDVTWAPGPPDLPLASWTDER